MTTISAKKLCVKCMTNPGIVTCDGCHQSFCHKHLSEHRRELSQEMEQIADQCETFRKNLRQENDSSPILSAIDLWEEQSIEKIRSAAENARADVRRLTERTITDFNQGVDKITKKIESSREYNDTTEIDLHRWNQQLQTLQDLLKQPFPISLANDDNPKFPVHFIRVLYEPPIKNSAQATKVKPKQHSPEKQESRPSLSQQPSTVVDEKFHQFAGHVILSEKNLAASSIGYSSICGLKLYALGTQRIRFRIMAKKNEGIFVGIITSMQDITARATELPSVYGWRDFDRAIINGNAQLKASKEMHIQPGDRLTLTVDCDNAELVLMHHRLNRKVQMSVDENMCPLPWKLLVSSYGGDIIHMLS